MVDALHARAAEAYAAGERLSREGLPEAALARLLEAVALHPEHPNARNFAGWLLTTRHRHEPEALAHGIDLLADAHAQSPDDITPLTNLVEALVAADRRRDAHDVVAAALAARPAWAEAWNLSGWLRGLSDGADDPTGAIADLTRALTLSRWYGDALFNLGRLALETGDTPAAIAALRAAIASGRCWRATEARVQLAMLEQQRGRLRVALGLYRTAAQHALAPEHAEAVHAGVQTCGQILFDTHRYLLHAVDEARRASVAVVLTTPRLSRLAAAARAVLPRLADPSLTAAREAVHVVIDCCDARDLLPRHADRSPSMQLQLAAAARSTAPALATSLRELAEQWTAAQRSLYDDLIVRDEPDPDEPASLHRDITTLAAHRRWHEALAALSTLDPDPSLRLTRANLAEALGDRARRDDDLPAAHRLYRLALADYTASIATAGREGGEREADARRVEASLHADD